MIKKFAFINMSYFNFIKNIHIKKQYGIEYTECNKSIWRSKKTFLIFHNMYKSFFLNNY